VTIFSGAQLFSLGIMGEYIARLHFRTMDRPPCALRSVCRTPEVPWMDARTDAIVDLLPWDAEHFGVRIARARGTRLTADAVAALDAWCAVNRVDCLYCRMTEDEQRRVIEGVTSFRCG
jgi:hypothetical protein